MVFSLVTLNMYLMEVAMLVCSKPSCSVCRLNKIFCYHAEINNMNILSCHVKKYGVRVDKVMSLMCSLNVSCARRHV